RPNGWLNLRYRYTLTGPQPWLGITFDFPEMNVTAMRWLGQGPYRVWKNRRAGQEVAVHYKTANWTDTGKQWDYPEFPGYHGQLYWAQLEATPADLTMATSTPDLFFRVLTPPVASTSRPGVSPAFPAGNLSFLHAINAIGTKFATPEPGLTGPTSALTLATGLYTGEVDFYFGELPPL
ncbi:MAG TPA: glycoside hydrolase family 2, partial [Verrucomicrobiota bacterium]|nr:glycoside hydrolase family 2 [Verrucomicrobiota bacterium]